MALSARDIMARRRQGANNGGIDVVDRTHLQQQQQQQQRWRHASPPKRPPPMDCPPAPPPPETPPSPPLDAQLRSPFDLQGSPPSERYRPDLIESSRPVQIPISRRPLTLEEQLEELCAKGWAEIEMWRFIKFRDVLKDPGHQHAIVQIIDTYGAVEAVSEWTRRATKRPVTVVNLPSIKLSNVEVTLASIWHGSKEGDMRSPIPVLCGLSDEYDGVVLAALEHNPRERVVVVVHRDPRELGRMYNPAVTTWNIALADSTVNQCSALIRRELGLPLSETAQNRDRKLCGSDPRWLYNQLRFSKIRCDDGDSDNDNGASQCSQLDASRDDGGAEPVMHANLRTLLGTDFTEDAPTWTQSLKIFVHAAYPVAIGGTIGESKMRAARHAALEGRKCPLASGRAIVAALDAIANQADAFSTLDTVPFLSRESLAAVDHEVVGRSTRVAIRRIGEMHDPMMIEQHCEDEFFKELGQLSKFKGLPCGDDERRLDAAHAAVASELWGCYLKLRPPRHAPVQDAIAYATTALWQHPEEPGQFRPKEGWRPVLPHQDPRQGLHARLVAQWFSERCTYPHFEASTAWMLAWSALAQDVQRVTSGAELLTRVANVIGKALDRVSNLRVGDPTDPPSDWLCEIETAHPRLFLECMPAKPGQPRSWPPQDMRRRSYNVWRAARTVDGPA